MKIFLPAVLVLAAVVLGSQARSQDELTHAPDGGNRTMIGNISIPPLTGAPFTATVSAQWSRPLGAGNVQVQHNSRLVARDSDGRVFQEGRWFVSESVQSQPPLSEIDISDPVSRTMLRCYPQSRLCFASGYFASVSNSLVPAGPLPNDIGYFTRVTLGTKTIDGFDATGTRETTTYNAAVYGNHAPFSVVKEIWYSPQLDLNLVVRRSDPRMGEEEFTVSNVSVSAPNPSLFQIPQGYRMANQPQTAP